MPIYEYVCEHCGFKFELYRSFWQSDDGIECPSCGQAGVTRQFSTFSSSYESSCSSG
jgi:putative FmdB family regulatory protein